MLPARDIAGPPERNAASTAEHTPLKKAPIPASDPCTEFSKSGGSISSTTIFTLVDRTPAEFKLSNEPPPIDTKLYRGRFKCLKPNECLSTDIVDNQVALLIKVHNLEEQIAFASTMDFYNAFGNSMDERRKLLSWTIRSEAINSDIIMVPIHVKQPGHYLLGIIMCNTREVIVINSLPGCPSDLVPYYQALL